MRCKISFHGHTFNWTHLWLIRGHPQLFNCIQIITISVTVRIKVFISKLPYLICTFLSLVGLIRVTKICDLMPIVNSVRYQTVGTPSWIQIKSIWLEVQCCLGEKAHQWAGSNESTTRTDERRSELSHTDEILGKVWILSFMDGNLCEMHEKRLSKDWETWIIRTANQNRT